ncbi:aldehyde dehydrogenase family protein [Schaalia naturae]|jgi:betaine-aldehyde dehydrogenase|uniref:Aldehyde dehydrogenase family protein n=1 Tax=Schaalia naturae TaxID=635203 RepID=A0ABW2SIJ5_9ACTO
MTGIEESALKEFWDDEAPRNYIAGTWREAGRRYDSVNPSTGSVFTSVPDSTAQEVDEAVSVAQAAGPQWASLSVGQRVETLMGLAPLLEDWRERLTLLESIDSGNPLGATRRDNELGARYLRQWPAQALTRQGAFRQPYADGVSLTTRVPYGVVGKIIAYNHPTLFPVAGMIYPLLAGNTMVIKASEQTPVATLALGRVIGEALPAGVVNIVSGRAEAGDALAVSPRVKRLAFTGSGSTALRIQSRLSVSGVVKHFSAELGGKNAIVVFADADLDRAVEAIVAGASLTISQGQSCQSTARVIVQDPVAALVEERVSARLRALRVGPAYSATTDMGPLVSATHLGRVLGLVDEAVSMGARVVCGGARLRDSLGDGFYMEPTMLADVPSGARIATEEVFGPVLTLETFSTESQAIALANQTDLGLSAAVWTDSVECALRVSFALQAGYVWVNDANRHYFGSPFGGVKGSGTGREESLEEFDSFTELRSVNIRVPGLNGAGHVGI